ncbi:hypothetical protein MUP01_10030 [Candidatus Bathyarchaeota archaeon]|jgi:hypothetical protein|nr:hypothetical protein [Candidatus Bathyarchaeota archaeon]
MGGEETLNRDATDNSIERDERMPKKKKTKRMPYKKMYYNLLHKFLKQQKPKRRKTHKKSKK